jgi:phosphatidylserine/phosphatidylglycerophosphate/cardiolipin synthase-like enzyme
VVRIIRSLVGRQQALDVCRHASPDRAHVYDTENHSGTTVYVHAKVCVINDVWACVGSDNFNRRSWTHDSELGCAVLDDTLDPRELADPAGLGDCARVFARDLRLQMLLEHLDRAAEGSEDDGLLDPDTVIPALDAAAHTLEDWHTRGRRGPRPPGRLRPHRPERLGRFQRLWSTPVYRMIYDPDGRSYRARLTGQW